MAIRNNWEYSNISTIETGDRLGSLWIRISRDRFESTVSLGHIYPYPRSPYNFKISWPQNISIYKILSDTIITLILMIKTYKTDKILQQSYINLQKTYSIQ